MTIIVATQQENVVRVYVGAPSNGGMNQVAQLSTNQPIDPHDLADMAVSLGVQFGWLNGITHEVDAAPAKVVHAVQSAPALLPVASATDPALGSYKTPRMAQLVRCPVKGCGHQARRKNLSQHLMSKLHNWPRDDANRAARVAQPIADAPVTPPDPKHYKTKPKRASVKSTKGGVSSLGIPANMRYGTVGKRELERVGYPKILEFVQVRGMVSSKMLATHFGESTSAAKHWLNQLEQRGDLVRTNPDAGSNEEHRYALAQRESVGIGSGYEEHTNPNPTQESR